MPKRQRGAALIVGLVLLMVLTVLGISGMNSATLELTMAGNTQFGQDAFQAAETGIDLVLARRTFSTVPNSPGNIIAPTPLGDGFSCGLVSVLVSVINVAFMARPQEWFRIFD